MTLFVIHYLISKITTNKHSPYIPPKYGEDDVIDEILWQFKGV